MLITLHLYRKPDFFVRMNAPSEEVTLILEITRLEDGQTKANRQMARRWFLAVNNWGKISRSMFHVCHNPQTLKREMAFLANEVKQRAA